MGGGFGRIGITAPDRPGDGGMLVTLAPGA